MRALGNAYGYKHYRCTSAWCVHGTQHCIVDVLFIIMHLCTIVPCTGIMTAVLCGAVCRTHSHGRVERETNSKQIALRVRITCRIRSGGWFYVYFHLPGSTYAFPLTAHGERSYRNISVSIERFWYDLPSDARIRTQRRPTVLHELWNDSRKRVFCRIRVYNVTFCSHGPGKRIRDYP